MLRTLLDFLDTIAVVEFNPSHAVHHLLTHLDGPTGPLACGYTIVLAPSPLTRIY